MGWCIERSSSTKWGNRILGSQRWQYRNGKKPNPRKEIEANNAALSWTQPHPSDSQTGSFKWLTFKANLHIRSLAQPLWVFCFPLLRFFFFLIRIVSIFLILAMKFQRPNKIQEKPHKALVTHSAINHIIYGNVLIHTIILRSSTKIRTSYTG